MTKITFNFKNLFACFVMASTLLLGAQDETTELQTYTPSEPICTLPPGEFTGLISIPRDPVTAAKMDAGGTPCATFVVNYNGFTPEAQAAFQYAVDIWANSIESPVPINLSATFASLGPGVLGSAGAETYITITSGAPGSQPNTFYPAALWEKLEGEDRSQFGGTNDISANFSSDTNWYYGTDANPPANQFDFVSVVLHELGHGLGFAGFANWEGGFPEDEGSIRFNGAASIYDAFIENGSGAAILSFPDPSAALADELVGNDLYCNAPTAIQQLNQGGTLPRVFAPTSWNPGSSYSHWNDSTFPNGDVNSLMTSAIGPGQANHNPGFITLGFFQDMGWGICPGALSVDDFTVSNVNVSPNPFVDEITVTLNKAYSDSFELNLIDINGRLIMSQKSDASNGRLTLSNLSDLDDALYFVKITNSSTGNSITKKVVKN
ncbi:T9SS type A sorting domain-containing protein [Winogradskyella vincentii]|uniref:T9SS type A sorting domain-containing protein n=1 Tax=Winogradskyella vincentii TaxID=2877122 RepID=A0ABS7XX88_9FLAO|nr:T9SS type A sorting domain-containing protein [Winogradskyella vincentii]MCA0152268.1 T9SS type A sorting domain-containing protein [Winogradskyella vincentii]